jgi:transcriptional regulator with XRE-family HTH domain
MKKSHAPTRFDRYLEDQLRDPDVASAYFTRRLIQEVAAAVRGMRESANLTQQQLAELIGSSQPTIARLERGLDQRLPRWDLLNRIGLALGRQLTISFEPSGARDRLVVVKAPSPRHRSRRRSAEISTTE